MILVDTSIWIDHFGRGDRRLAALLDTGRVLIHPFVIGEIALGQLKRRELVLRHLSRLPSVTVADATELLYFIARNGLAGSGIGYVDAHLIASVYLSPGSQLWSRDKRLQAAAVASKIAYREPRSAGTQPDERRRPSRR